MVLIWIFENVCLDFFEEVSILTHPFSGLARHHISRALHGIFIHHSLKIKFGFGLNLNLGDSLALGRRLDLRDLSRRFFNGYEVFLFALLIFLFSLLDFLVLRFFLGLGVFLDDEFPQWSDVFVNLDFEMPSILDVDPILSSHL